MTDGAMIHERALCESEHVGAGTRIYAFTHVLEGARIGRDCNLNDGVFVEGDVVVGDRVTVKSGVQLWNGVTLEDDVFVGPNATFTNDPYPRSRQWLDDHPRTTVRRGASIGANATILPGLEIGIGAMVGAGAVVTRSVPPHAVVVGNPARIVGYEGAQTAADTGRSTGRMTAAELTEPVTEVGVGGVTVHRFAEHGDMRGNLTAGPLGEPEGVPFAARRWFMVYDVPTREVRGEHAHRVCHQFLMCPHGSVVVAVDDGRNRAEVVLNERSVGVYLPPMVWGTQYRYERDTTLLVLASHPYDADDYIRDYGQFLAERGDGPGGA